MPNCTPSFYRISFPVVSWYSLPPHIGSSIGSCSIGRASNIRQLSPVWTLLFIVTAWFKAIQFSSLEEWKTFKFRGNRGTISTTTKPDSQHDIRIQIVDPKLPTSQSYANAVFQPALIVTLGVILTTVNSINYDWSKMQLNYIYLTNQR